MRSGEFYLEKNTIHGARIIDSALQIGDYLIIADLHFGYEQSLNRAGLMIPRFQYEKIIERIKEIITRSDASKIILNGDLKHEFGKITRQEWKEIDDFIRFLKNEFKEIILIKGNHDNFTPFIAEKNDLKVFDHFSVENYFVIHGDKIPLSSINEDTIIIGHEHPSLGLKCGERIEKIKCFLKGKWQSKNVIVMPSFNFVSEGSDVLHEKPISPFLNDLSMDEFEVFGIENFEILYFGKLKDVINIKKNM